MTREHEYVRSPLLTSEFVLLSKRSTVYVVSTFLAGPLSTSIIMSPS